MTFRMAVEAAPPPVNGAYRPGKQALNGYRNRVNCADSRRLTGSMDLDSALKKEQAHAARWDYGLGYKPPRGREQAIWVEVHAATTGEVSRVLDKLQWLKDWLNGEAEDLKRLTDRAGADIRYVWIARGKVRIPSHLPQARRLNQSGLSLKTRLASP